MDNTSLQQAPFPYEKESVLGTIPYIRCNTVAGVTRWMIIFTTSAAYFVYFGSDRTFMPTLKAKKVEKEVENKSLEVLLKMGQHFYRVGAGQMSNVSHKNGLFKAKIWFVNSEKNKISLQLSKNQYAKFLELLPMLKATKEVSQTEIVHEITRQGLNPATLAPILSPEEQIQETRRRKALGWVLLVNSILSLVLAAWLGGKGTVNSITVMNIVPAIIDISIAIALFTGKTEAVQWVFIRSVLGLLIWGLLLVTKQDWVTFLMQIPYFGYLIYHSKVKASIRSFRIAMGILVLAIVVLVGATAYGYKQTNKNVKKFDARLTVYSQAIDKNLLEQNNLIFSNSTSTDEAEAKQLRNEVLNISYNQKEQLKQVLPIIDEGLRDYKDAGSQKNLGNLKALYELEVKQNQSVIDVYEYLESIDAQNPSPEQIKIYKQKEQAVIDAFAAVKTQAIKIQNENR